MWRKNLVVCWIGMFFSYIGTSQVAPILPIYINTLGVTNVGLVQRLTGLIFGCTFIIAAIASPIWGKAADKYGRKAMLLRASLGMGIIISLMAFVTNVYQLLALRALQGAFLGYATACTTLIATQVDKEHAGIALGTLATASAGTLIGPTVGGYIASYFGIRNVFVVTGSLCIVAFVISLLFIVEDFKPVEKVKDTPKSNKKGLFAIPNASLILSIFVTAFITQLALYSIEPIITVYISQLTNGAKNVALISGLAFSATGFASIIAARVLGKLSDKSGPHKVLLGSLLWAGFVFIPQAFVNSPWELMALRFLLGLSVAGLNPSTNSILKKISPDNETGTIFGYNASFQYVGVAIGSIMGGQISALFGMKSVFIITSMLLFINAIWIYKFTGLFGKNREQLQ